MCHFIGRASALIAGRTILLGALLLLGTLLAFMWLDLVWAIPTAGRWAITRIGIMAAIVAMVATWWWKSRRVTPGHVAYWIDTQAKTGGEMLAGWQLEQRPPTKASSLTQGLAQMASARASQRLAAIEPEAVLPADALKKAAWMLCGGIGLTVLLTIIIPGIAWNQWQRFAFPSRDVPPYTGIVIELDPSEAKVLYGDDVTIKANVTAGRVNYMELVTVTPDGKKHIVPMLEQRADRFQAILMRLTTPMDVYARSGRARSRIGRITVQMTPQIVSTKVRITPPAYTKRPAFEGAIPKDGIVGLAGTEVEFTVTSNRPLRRGRLMLADRDGSGQETTLQPIASPEVDETVAPKMRPRFAAPFGLKSRAGSNYRCSTLMDWNRSIASRALLRSPSISGRWCEYSNLSRCRWRHRTSACPWSSPRKTISDLRACSYIAR